MKTLIIEVSSNENKKLATKLSQIAKNLGSEVKTINLEDNELPLYTMKKETENGIPELTFKIKNMINEANNLIIVSPEYNGSIPPMLTNTIAWISRSSEDFREVFSEKPILLATHSGSGGIGLHAALRLQFTKLGGIIIPREIITTYQVPFVESSSIHCVEQLLRVTKG